MAILESTTEALTPYARAQATFQAVQHEVQH
jgi:hypothetical protein